MQALRNLRGFLRPFRLWAVLAPVLMLVEVAMDLAQPRLVQRIVDQGIARSNGSLVAHTGAIMIACAMIGLVGGAGCTVFSVLASQGFGADLRWALFGKTQTLSYGNLDALGTGALVTRLTNDVTRVQDAVLNMLRVMIRVPLLLVGSLAMGILTSPSLALIYVFLIPAVLTALIWIINRAYPLFSQVQRRLDALNTVLQEGLAGVRVVKAFARADFEKERFGRANDLLMDRNFAALRMTAVTQPIMMSAVNVGVVAALWYGGNRVASGHLHVGQVIAFINYLTQTLFALVMVSMLTMQMSRAEASAQRISEVLGVTPLVANGSETVEPAGRGTVAFENVTFRYDGDEAEAVLRSISFTAQPGQTIVVLGATGAGKSTLVQLIPRFYDVSDGRVTIDGVDVRNLDQSRLRAQIGVALQEAVLFTGTIRDNIRYGWPDATDDEVVAAARTAQADDFICSFPDGYDSAVGQRGVNLSGGQKQRIAIARALIGRPPILILDDSTSAVDMRTEARIHDALGRDPDQTRIVVAQRIRTALRADKILLLDGGMLVAEGTHEELLAASPIYREICESQSEDGREARDDE